MPIAKKATKYDTFLKIMAWGEPGAGKTRLALSFPGPLVIDLERGSRLYADQFDFLVAEPTPQMPGIHLVKAVVDEVVKGEYPDSKTLVIDPITDYLDQLEWEFAKLKESRGINLDSMKAPQKAGYYAEQKDFIRQRLDAILRLPMNVVFIARAKNNWEGSQVNGRKPDASEIVEYLCDIVLHIERGGTAQAKKSRLKELPPVIRAVTFADIDAAIKASPDKTPTAAPATPQGPRPAAVLEEPPQPEKESPEDEKKRLMDETTKEIKRSNCPQELFVDWAMSSGFPSNRAEMTAYQLRQALKYLQTLPTATKTA